MARPRRSSILSAIRLTGPCICGALQDYYASHLERLCFDCQRRYHLNPLRLLDCKQPVCQPFLTEAPRSADYLGASAREHWEALLGFLGDLQIGYRLDHRLVRGLDYYTRTVFEIVPAEEGAQSAVAGGGRYDGLMEQLGGRPTPGVGFAAGFERIIMNIQRQNVTVPPVGRAPIVVAYQGSGSKTAAIRLAARLREQHLTVVLAPERSLKAQMRYASNVGAPQVLILGDREMAAGVASVRDMARGTQEEVDLDSVATRLASA